MNFYSTNHRSPSVGLEEALLNGLAPDGGLYYPAEIPHFSAREIAALQQTRETSEPVGFLQHVAFRVLDRWFTGEIPSDELERIAREAHSFPIPVRRVGGMEVLELFHGPTMAFKDVAARHLAQLMGYFLRKRGERALLLVATSGDTGGAIAAGFAGQETIQGVILFPKGKVSQLQEEQLTRVAPNILPVEVEGVFDDCQTLVKRAFTHPALQHLPLTSANSINVARLIPQIIPYIYAALLLDRPDLEIVVPSGNFGNLTAALFAGEMGFPLHHFIAATNENDAAARYFESGHYQPQPTEATLSTAMDVGNPSNFARVLELFDHRLDQFRTRLRAYGVTDAETVDTIRAVYEREGYLLCPHSAVGWRVAEQHGAVGRQPLVVATASPAKFAREIQEATGLQVDNRAAVEQLQALPKRKITIPNEWEALELLLRELAQERL